MTDTNNTAEPDRMVQVFAARLREAREAKGLTQNQLAFAIARGDGMTVSRWERAANFPNAEARVALARVLERDELWFFSEPEAEEDAA